MKNITLTTNFNVADKVEVARAAILRFTECGGVVTLPNFAKSVLGDMKNVCFVPTDKLYDKAELIAVVGGDGSVIEAARRAAVKEIPILGINKGRLGYMSSLEVNEIDKIDRIMQGDYYIDDRMMIEAEVKSGQRTLYVSRGLNDVVVSNGSVARMIDLEVIVDEMTIGTYRADGMIVTTPTGSTAYSLSAGGPIMAPNLKGFCITPICAHAFAARPIVFPDDSVIEIKNICTREPHLYMTVDGRINIRLGKGQVVRITRSEKHAKIVRVKEHNFYTELYRKLESI